MHSSVALSLIPVVGGVMLATKTEVNFDMNGFMACLLASALTGTDVDVCCVLTANLSGTLNFEWKDFVWHEQA